MNNFDKMTPFCPSCLEEVEEKYVSVDKAEPSTGHSAYAYHECGETEIFAVFDDDADAFHAALLEHEEITEEMEIAFCPLKTDLLTFYNIR